MPFKSEAQRRYFYAQARKGKIPWDVVEEWERKTGGRPLPERVNKKKKAGKKNAKKKQKKKTKKRKKAASRNR